MVVIVILGVLAALVVPRVLERPDEARAIAAKSDIAAIMQALKLYRLDNQRYPTAEQGSPRWSRSPSSRPCRPTGSPAATSRSCRRIRGDVPTCTSTRASRRDRRLELRRRRPAGRQRASTPTSARGTCERGCRIAPQRARLHADRDPGGAGDPRDRARGVAVVAFDGGDRERAMREARRFAGALEHAAARAQVRAETLGVSAQDGTLALLAARSGQRPLATARRRRRARARTRCPRRMTRRADAYSGQRDRGRRDRAVAPDRAATSPTRSSSHARDARDRARRPIR